MSSHPTFSAHDLAHALDGLHPDLRILGPDALAGRYPGEDPGNLNAGVMAQPGARR